MIRALLAVMVTLPLAGCVSTDGEETDYAERLTIAWKECSARAYGYGRRSIESPHVAAEQALASCETESNAIAAHLLELGTPPAEIFAFLSAARASLKRQLVELDLS